jgi:hypothetical protein
MYGHTTVKLDADLLNAKRSFLIVIKVPKELGILSP